DIISAEHNCVWGTTDITAHAEIHAIRKACRKLNHVLLEGCVIYSTCEPCPMCFSACHWARIEKIVYGATINDARDAGFNELTVSNVQLKKYGESPIQIVGGCLKKETLQLFSDWQHSDCQKAY
ncbi:MAG: nucleoside deaminase, partial [Candidatus Omnitrophica bacterium]|nr:nucleoside deaminase [Candidatus Omnitrophota bacterium]